MLSVSALRSIRYVFGPVHNIDKSNKDPNRNTAKQLTLQPKPSFFLDNCLLSTHTGKKYMSKLHFFFAVVFIVVFIVTVPEMLLFC